MEYENTGAIDKNHDGDAACVVCMHKTASHIYVQWGRNTCTGGHTTEYSGLVMGKAYSQSVGQTVCVDTERALHKRSVKHDDNGGLLYTTDMQQGSSDEIYPHDREVSCAVCSSTKPVYSRWGSRTCPSGNALVYEGFMASNHHSHGGGASALCMHPDPESPQGYSDHHNGGNKLYGMEYKDTGAIDKNHAHDAACAVCEQQSAETVYVQWGRN